ncbi:MAG: Gldg family protein [Alphaproteobacteria bacterium]|nr:Gldg family protein [Alphaproteobacteria bacterium]
MQQIKALLKKEFIGFFRSYLAYFLVFIYIGCSIGGAYYIGSLLAAHDSGLYSMFFFQPILLTVIIPAITMKMWAEEYKQGTAEFLLTQPVSYSRLVTAKFVASWSFCIFLSLLLLPFVYYVSEQMVLDGGNIVSAYIGLWMFMAVFCAFGCFVSAFCKNIILAYIVSVTVMALLLFIPYNFIGNAYNNMMFAEIGAEDIVAPIMLTFTFLLLNKTVLDYAKTSISHKNLRFGTFCTFLIGAVIIFLIGLRNFATSKADLTSASSYTPKDKSVDIIRSVQKPLTINLYIAKDFLNSTTDNAHHFQQISRFLQKYSDISQGMIQFNAHIADAFSEIEEQALSEGLYFELNQNNSRNYFGAVITSENKPAVIKQFLRPRQMFAERDIDKAISKITHPEKIKTIGVYMDSQHNLSEFEGLLLALEDDYNVELIPPTTYQIHTDTDLLLMINPKKIEPTLLYAVDQYIMHGGKTVIFYDFYTENQSRLVNREKIDVLRFLRKWQIELSSEMTDDAYYNKDFGKILHTVKLNKATPFKKNETLHFKPFLFDNDLLIGAVVSGEFKSTYQENPYEQTSLGKKMYPHTAVSPAETQIALIGDVDILLDRNWVNNSSPDKNPYSLIETNGNGAAALNLINYMLQNEDYADLPINTNLLNTKSIGEKLKSQIFSQHEAEYMALKNKIAQDKVNLFIASGNNYDVMNELAYVTSSGRTIKQHEKKLKQMEYAMLSEYGTKIRLTASAFAILWPLSAILLCFMLFSLKNKIRQRKISEMINE